MRTVLAKSSVSTPRHAQQNKSKLFKPRKPPTEFPTAWVLVHEIRHIVDHTMYGHPHIPITIVLGKLFVADDVHSANTLGSWADIAAFF